MGQNPDEKGSHEGPFHVSILLDVSFSSLVKNCADELSFTDGCVRMRAIRRACKIISEFNFLMLDIFDLFFR